MRYRITILNDDNVWEEMKAIEGTKHDALLAFAALSEGSWHEMRLEGRRWRAWRPLHVDLGQ